MREISPVENWLMITLGMALSGVIYGLVAYPEGSLFAGAVFAVFIGLPLIAFERRVFLRPLYRRIERFPTVGFIVSALVIYEIMMSVGYAAAAIFLSSLKLIQPISLNDLIMPFHVFVYALAVCALIVFILRVRDLLGRDVFTSMLISRYRTPVREERVFLFIDLAGSTAYAEKHGDLRAQQFLNALFSAFAEPVRHHRGAIDDYVGDAAIVTWPLRRGVKNARCIRCVFDIIEDIRRDAGKWNKKFGEVPQLRFALHGGSIITAEIGVDHHKIAYFGDTVNTTARLESLCKTLDRPVLISTDLAQHIKVPDTIAVEDLGAHAVKGRGQTLGVMSLSPASKMKLVPPIELRIPAE